MKEENVFSESEWTFHSVLAMVHVTQNHWAFGHCLQSGVLQSRRHSVSETESVSVLRWREGDNYSVRSLRNNWTSSF
jgi:hypothetical protein